MTFIYNPNNIYSDLPLTYTPDYVPTNTEMVDVIGGTPILYNTVEHFAELYANAIDPNGDFPDLSTQLAEAMLDDPAFLDQVIELYNPDLYDYDPTDPDSPAPPQSEEDLVNSINSDIAGKAAGILGNLIPEFVDEKIATVTQEWADLSKAANDNWPKVTRLVV